jgi:hypothetical protein
MSGKAGEQGIRVYCPRDGEHFEALAVGKIVCAADAHVLAEQFPFDGFWEYCCDCERFYPLELAREKREKDGSPADCCLTCASDLIRHYLCDECNVISHKSRDRDRGLFSISATGLVRPSCPGCLTVKPTSVTEHVCRILSIGFTTARESCPFCKEAVAPETHIAGLLSAGAVGGAALAVVATAKAATSEAAPGSAKVESESLAVGHGAGEVAAVAAEVEAEPAALHVLGTLKRFFLWVNDFYHKRKWVTGSMLGMLLAVAGLLFADPIYKPFTKWRNHPPEIKMIKPTPPKISGGGSVTLTAITEDKDGDKLDYKWTSSAGTIVGEGQIVTLVLAEADGQTGGAPITVSVSVEDKHGDDASNYVQVGVIPPPQNQSPRLTDLRAERQSVTVGERVQLTAVAEDPDRENLTYHWAPSDGGIEDNGRPVAFLNTEGINVTSGEVKIRVILTVKDARDLAVSNSLEITVQPSQTAESPAPAPAAPSNKSPFFLMPPPEEADVTAGETLALEAYAMDPDGDVLEYVWTTQRGRIEGTGASVTLHTADLNAAKSNLRSFVTLTVKDRWGATTSGVVRVRVLPAEPPRAEPVPTTRPEPSPTPADAPPAPLSVEAAPEGLLKPGRR